MEVLLIAALIMLNGLFAMSEIAVVSSRKVRLRHWAESGNSGAAVALRLAEDPGHFLSTIQVGITLIGILNGAFGETVIAGRLSTYFASIPELAPYSEPLALGVMVLVLTSTSLIIGELVPKRLALHNPERIAALVARPMRWLAIAAYPLVMFLSGTTEILVRLFGPKQSREPSITEEEIKVLMEQGTVEGVFERSEHELVSNIFSLDGRRVSAIMTPRKDIVHLDLADSPEANLEKLLSTPYSRIPLCVGRFEEVLGIVQAKDLLKQALRGDSVDFRSAAQAPLYVPVTFSLTRLLETFRNSPMQIALVIDEYGDVEGLVTVNDVLEAVVGEIASEDLEEAEAVCREDGSWLIDGMMALDKFKRLFHIAQLPGEADGEFHTLGGFVMAHLGRVPKAADHFHWDSLRFEVVDMDRHRVDKIMVSREPPPVATTNRS
jgi:putative hemolysin